MRLVEIENSLKEIENERAILKEDFESSLRVLNNEARKMNKLKKMSLSNIDISLVTMAESILRFDSGFARYHKPTVVAAISDIASGADELRERYFGVKDYAHWSDQEVKCRYGMGPNHGNVVFRVGIAYPHKELNMDERNACIYYLNHVMREEFRSMLGGN